MRKVKYFDFFSIENQIYFNPIMVVIGQISRIIYAVKRSLNEQQYKICEKNKYVVHIYNNIIVQ